MCAEERERWIEGDHATGDHTPALSDEGRGELGDDHHENRDEDRLNERDPPHRAAPHAERRDEDRIAGKAERLGHECLGSGGTRVFAGRDDSPRQSEVLLLIVADRVPVRGEVRAVGEREEKAHCGEREDRRVTADAFDHERDCAAHHAENATDGRLEQAVGTGAIRDCPAKCSPDQPSALVSGTMTEAASSAMLGPRQPERDVSSRLTAKR